MAEEEAGEELIDEDGAVTVIPIEGEQPGLAGALFRGLGGERCMKRAVAAANDFDPPFENISDGGLAGLDTVEAGQNRAFHDAADSGNIADGLRRRNDGAIAGGRADDFDEHAFGDPAADGAVVDIHFADGDGDASGQAELLGPFGAEGTGGGIGVVGLFVKAIAEGGECGIEEREKFFVRQTTPIVRIEGLVAGAADAADHIFGVIDSGEHGRNPVGEFHPRVRGCEDFRGDVAAVPDLRPEPFGRVDVTTLGDEVRAMFRRERSDLGGLAVGGVVLPKPALGIEVLLPLGGEGERAVVGVDGNRARTGGVNAETDHLIGSEALRFFRDGKGSADGFFKTEKVVAGMLAGEVVILGVQQHALLTGRIIDDARAELCAIGTTHDERAD